MTQIDERAKSLAGPDIGGTTPSMVFAKANQAKVKGIAEEYSQSKSAVIVPTHTKDGKVNGHPLAGKQATFLNRNLELPQPPG